MAIYGFPMDEEDYLLPMCLVLFTAPDQISALRQLLDILDDLEEADEIDSYVPQFFASRVELHISHLNRFSAMLLLVFISSKRHFELGDWCFVPSAVGQLQN